MTTRIPSIVQTVLADHAGLYPPQIRQSLQDLHDEIVEDKPVRPLETTAPDGPVWTEAWQPYRDRTWLDIPWYFAETFFYRRLLEAAGYFGGEEEHIKNWGGVDPFLPRKQAELQIPPGQAVTPPWRVLASVLSHTADNSARSFRLLLHHCLWGNRVDLSYDKIAQSTGRQIVVDSEQANLLLDDTGKVLAHLQPSRFSPVRPALKFGGRRAAGDGRLDFICDNTGTELLMDLALADFLLRFDWVQQVTLHVKADPTFVSDATAADVDMTIAAIKVQTAVEPQGLADRLENYRRTKRLLIQADLFWNSSRFFWEIPPPLRTDLARAHLVFIKGDANYRRLLGDSCCWPPTVPLADAVPYFPAPFVALRTMKSDPVVGLKPGQAEALDQADSEWRVNGKRGMIQALSGHSKPEATAKTVGRPRSRPPHLRADKSPPGRIAARCPAPHSRS